MKHGTHELMSGENHKVAKKGPNKVPKKGPKEGQKKAKRRPNDLPPPLH
jgi:hypothetical protein